VPAQTTDQNTQAPLHDQLLAREPDHEIQVPASNDAEHVLISADEPLQSHGRRSSRASTHCFDLDSRGPDPQMAPRLISPLHTSDPRRQYAGNDGDVWIWASAIVTNMLTYHGRISAMSKVRIFFMMSSEGLTNHVLDNASYLAICAEPGTDWMSRRMGLLDFTTVARELAFEIWGSRTNQAVSPVRATEPDFETAWSWTQG
jgi:hypothetical protein